MHHNLGCCKEYDWDGSFTGPENLVQGTEIFSDSRRCCHTSSFTCTFHSQYSLQLVQGAKARPTMRCIHLVIGWCDKGTGYRGSFFLFLVCVWRSVHALTPIYMGHACMHGIWAPGARPRDVGRPYVRPDVRRRFTTSNHVICTPTRAYARARSRGVSAIAQV